MNDCFGSEENNTSTNEKVYKEKKWGKKEGGDYIVDGVTFKGKNKLKRAKEGLSDMLIKGLQSEVNGTKFKVLDTQLKGSGLEIDVRIEGKSESGIGILKLYGPNKKSKEYTIMVNKHRDSDIKFVTVLADKIVKPLINRFTEGQEEISEKEILLEEDKKFRCEICEKAFETAQGLKGHVTKMHRKSKSNEILITDVIFDETTNLEENVDTQDEIITEKKYKNNCSECKFEVEANRKYELIQIMLRHNEHCSSNNKRKKEQTKTKDCEICGYTANSEYSMKRHNRDKHGKLTDSTSPPQKRKRIKSFETNLEVESNDMEIDDEEKDLSFQMEDMEIDAEKNNEEKLRSKRMDEKILSRQLKIEENERLFQEEKKKKEQEKREEEKRQLENQKMLNKKRKQLSKNEKRKSRKKNLSISKIRNIKSVPENCAHLVKKDDVVYVVPGNGACGPNCASAFLFEDEVFGDSLRRKMNVFMANQWERRYKYITQCSPGHPFIRKLNGGEVKFTDPEKLVNFLRNSEQAERMWSDSEDFAVISDMYQLKIKIITSKGEDDKNPTVNWIYPCEDLKEFAELKDVEMDEMVLLHQDDSHFDLVVSKDSNLAKYGSLSYRTNVGPLKEIHETKAKESIPRQVTNQENSEEKALKEQLDKMKNEIKELNESKSVLEKEYLKCEQLLKNKTEEAAKLSIELRDLKEIISLENKLQENVSLHDSDQSLAEEKEYNCNECSLQATSAKELDKHIDIKHRIQCRICGEAFDDKPKLMSHRKNMHIESVAFCKNKALEKCPFTSEKCWWRHTNKSDVTEHAMNHTTREIIKCYLCQTEFEGKGSMMLHRKKEHKNAVKPCNQFLENNCRFSNEGCWFIHDDKKQEKVEEKAAEPVFQNAQENIKPPIK